MDEKRGKVELPKTSAFEQMRLWYEDPKMPVVASTEVNKQSDSITITKRDRDDALRILDEMELIDELHYDDYMRRLREILDA